MTWCHTNTDSFYVSCHLYNLIESHHHSWRTGQEQSARVAFSCDSRKLVLLKLSNELQWKTTWRRQEGLLHGQRWKRPNVPVRTRGDWNYFSQGVLFIIHDSHFRSFIFSAGGVGMGEGILCLKTAGKGKQSPRTKLREWGVNIIAALLNLFKLHFMIRFCFHSCLVMPFGCYLVIRFYP